MDVLPVVVAVATLGAATVLATAPAHADPDDLVGLPLVLERGAVELRLTAEINVQVRSVGRPLALAPDAWWGVSPRWTIGLIHSDPSVDQVATSASFCVRESALSTCDRLYHGGGFDVRYSALEGPFALAPRLRAVIRDTDPFKPAIMLGALIRWTRGRFAIASDPYLRVPLANHALGNPTAIMLPVWLAIQPAAGWMIALRTGLDADLVVLSDGWHGALALDATARVTDEIDLGIEAGWGSLIGPQHDARHATVMLAATWHG